VSNSSVKSPRDRAKAEGRKTYVARPCKRCKSRKRFTANAGCKKCHDDLQAAKNLRAKEHAALLNVPVNALKVRPAPAIVGIHVCPTCKRPWPAEGET
jgi:hypothetical protein